MKKPDTTDYIHSLLRVIVTSIIGGYIFFTVTLYLSQDSFIFHDPRMPDSELVDFRKFYEPFELITELYIETNDGIKLNGWLIREDSKKPAPIIIFFGGNGEDVSHNILDKRLYPGYSLALINYRGYGISEGKPSEKALFEDAITIYDYFASQDYVDKDNIVLMGRSLGSGVATYLASKRKTKGVVLLTPFDSVVEVARTHFPVLPVDLMLKHKFDSISLAGDLNIPMLTIAAEKDIRIPYRHAKKLFDQWGSPDKEFVLLEGANHNNALLSRKYWQAIGRFLEKIKN